jgi:hypothetical protein
MYGVCLALMPALVASLYFFGLGAAVVLLTSIVSCVLFEWAIAKFILRRERTTIMDGSAILTVTTEDGGHTDMLTVVVNDGTSVEDIKDATGLDLNAPMYDVVGRQVDATYRGIIIQNGNKYLLK